MSLPCDLTGVPVVGTCPAGYTWDQTECRCVGSDPDVCFGDLPSAQQSCAPCMQALCFECTDRPIGGGPCPDPECTFELPNNPFDTKCWRPIYQGTGEDASATHPNGPYVVGATCWWCPDPIAGTFCVPPQSACSATCPLPYSWNQWTLLCEPPDCDPGLCWDEELEECVPCDGGGDPGEQPFNLRSHFGWYYRAFVNDGDPYVARARGLSTPPFDATERVAEVGTATRPVLVEDMRERLRCLWSTDTPEVFEATSDDDAETWSDPVSLFADGAFPIVRQDPTSGALLAAARVGTNIQTRLRYPGDEDWRDAVTLEDASGALAIEEEAFGMEWMGDGQGRVVFAVRLDGETVIREYVSFDDGATCAEVT